MPSFFTYFDQAQFDLRQIVYIDIANWPPASRTDYMLLARGGGGKPHVLVPEGPVGFFAVLIMIGRFGICFGWLAGLLGTFLAPDGEYD